MATNKRYTTTEIKDPVTGAGLYTPVGKTSTKMDAIARGNAGEPGKWNETTGSWNQAKPAKELPGRAGTTDYSDFIKNEKALQDRYDAGTNTTRPVSPEARGESTGKTRTPVYKTQPISPRKAPVKKMPGRTKAPAGNKTRLKDQMKWQNAKKKTLARGSYTKTSMARA